MPKRWHFPPLPICTDCFGAHRVHIALLQLNTNAIADWLALLKPLVFEWNLDAKPHADCDIPLRIAVKADAALFDIIVDVQLGVKGFSLLAEEVWQRGSHTTKRRKLGKWYDRTLPIFHIRFLSDIGVAQVPSSKLVDDPTTHPSFPIRLKIFLLLTHRFETALTSKESDRTSNDQQTS